VVRDGGRRRCCCSALLSHFSGWWLQIPRWWVVADPFLASSSPWTVLELWLVSDM